VPLQAEHLCSLIFVDSFIRTFQVASVGGLLRCSRIDTTTGPVAAAPIPAIISDFIDRAVINLEHELRSLTESVARRTDREPNGCTEDKHLGHRKLARNQ
jgi:hypothetical protein